MTRSWCACHCWREVWGLGPAELVQQPTSLVPVAPDKGCFRV